MAAKSLLVLGIDTCGPTGSVALGRLSATPGLEGRCSNGSSIEILGQTELDGRRYSEKLVTVVGDLLRSHGVKLRGVGCIVAVNGPGSFTGVRVGLSTVKGFAMGAGMPVVTISRLAVLTAKAGVNAAALDAHRGEVFLRVVGGELLAGVDELAEIAAPERMAVCDEAAAKVLRAAWPETELVEVAAPTAADALEHAASRVLAGDFVELALLDGNYLRRSDAEIHFGASA
ncbi:tRNA (adenosine(37)-N6)-threonylcarbamoyltransferase complex dimerization subunit type 1 TsaB [Terracidiphilus gabretensis]|uniref:tRNA (adenosine(37)-N6)-threonylcarbamoyltransferase complex dimerization subunit type 1 TsaB n=1 Tax=Terracidiphilus gabretensis TaxID=1577687 RepID=UPI0009EC31F3|nr:tRNA (adenosine(37)-N6)-threonylcarbamoyltransferase complex dimerization subunit type 1 TsaB [Terracidiphilus gabretensis]